LKLSNSQLPSYTKSQLTRCNGQDSDKIWIAFKGDIYDVTPSRHWKAGIHYEHWAGQDLTDELKDAPHAEEVFKRYPKIGVLEG